MNLTTLLQKNSILIFLIASFFGNLYSQVNWDKYKNNPILNVGDPGTWESNLSGPTSVIYHDDIYEAWLIGTDDEDTGRIGYASSSDGIIWDKYENNPVVDIGEVGTWDSLGVVTSAVLFDTTEQIYKMWYAGLDGSFGRTGYATSDPVSNLNSDMYMIIPNHISLMQNYPNPFNPLTMINYQLSTTNNVELAIYNLLGQKVETLVSEEQNAGYHQVEWDASDFSSGIYFYVLRNSERNVQKRKMMLIK